ncbi:MAG TPA: adenine phosphoribosyltransferase [Gemmatimonadaceae bacterium]|nr:adenine phosphoribosyltransferase [Gemmatimonadaceae bacterium]
MSTSAHPADRALESRLRAAIRDIPDYPKPGIVFKDITPLLGDRRLFAQACEAMSAPFRDAGVTHVAAIESRGFLFGGAVAQLLAAGIAPVRKRGKLPYHAAREDYALEYGIDSLEMHLDALPPAARVLVVDDVLATGGTAAATCRLVERLGGEVAGCSFLMRLGFLSGLAELNGRRVSNLVVY